MGYHGKQYKGAARDTKILKRNEANARDARSDHNKIGRKLRELKVEIREILGVKSAD